MASNVKMKLKEVQDTDRENEIIGRNILKRFSTNLALMIHTLKTHQWLPHRLQIVRKLRESGFSNKI